MSNIPLNKLIEYFDTGDTVKCIFYRKFQILGFIQWREEWQNNITYKVFKIEDKRETLCYVGDDYNYTKIHTCRLVLTEKIKKIKCLQ